MYTPIWLKNLRLALRDMLKCNTNQKYQARLLKNVYTCKISVQYCTYRIQNCAPKNKVWCMRLLVEFSIKSQEIFFTLQSTYFLLIISEFL